MQCVSPLIHSTFVEIMFALAIICCLIKGAMICEIFFFVFCLVQFVICCRMWVVSVILYIGVASILVRLFESCSTWKIASKKRVDLTFNEKIPWPSRKAECLFKAKLKSHLFFFFFTFFFSIFSSSDYSLFWFKLTWKCKSNAHAFYPFWSLIRKCWK